MVARQQLERWTGFLAFNTNTPREPGEDTLSCTARVWSAVPDGRLNTTAAADDTEAGSLDTNSFDDPATAEPDLDHRHVITRSGEEICPAAVLGALGGSCTLMKIRRSRCGGTRFTGATPRTYPATSMARTL
jgi:hypothetical protein